MEINLIKEMAGIVATSYRCFDLIVGLPENIRLDDKTRTGIQVFARVPDTRNSINVPIHYPSKDAQWIAIEKAVRSYTLGDYSSQNSEDPDKMRFRGCVMVEISGILIQVSVSGLKPDEDVVTSVNILADIFVTSPSKICENIVFNKGMLPAAFGYSGYLRSMLQENWR